VHDGLPHCGLFCPTSCAPALHIGVAQSPSWDPFYFVDRTVMSLFFAAMCLVYLNNGLIPAAFVAFFFLMLRARVRVQGQAVFNAMFKAQAEQASEDGVAMSDSEQALHNVLSGAMRAAGTGATSAMHGEKAAAKSVKGFLQRARPTATSSGSLDADASHMC